MLYHIAFKMLWLILRPLAAVLGGLRVEGRENVPRQGGVLVTPNHLSDSDPPFVGLTLPRSAYYMAKHELFDVPVLGSVMRLLRAFPVKRHTADRAALRHTEQLLKAGEAVVIFPEGQCSEFGNFQPLNPGVILMAMHTGVPILPVGLVNTNRFLPYAKVIPRHAGRRVIVRFGKPIPIAELTGGRQGREALDYGVEYLSRAILALAEYPPGHAAPLQPKPLQEEPSARTVETAGRAE